MFMTAIEGHRCIQEPILNADQLHSTLAEILRQNSKLIEFNSMIAEALTARPKVHCGDGDKLEDDSVAGGV
jgi:hypothetical protein